MSNFSGIGGRVKGPGFVGDVVAFLLVLSYPDAACIGPEPAFMGEDGKMSQVEEESFKFKWFLAFVIQIHCHDDIVPGPVFGLKVTTCASAQGVTGFALGAIAVPGLAEGFRRDAGELAQAGATFAVNLDT